MRHSCDTLSLPRSGVAGLYVLRLGYPGFHKYGGLFVKTTLAPQEP